MKLGAILLLFFWINSSVAQSLDTLKVVSYNLLNFPELSPHRIDSIEKIMAYLKPDILMVCELTSGSGADNILFNALNEGGTDHYDMADFVPGPDTQNMLYFNSDKLRLKEQNVIETALRDINEYVLFYKNTDFELTTDTTFFYVYVCHLKASAGFEDQRNAEALAMKNYLDGRVGAENILIGGDFNFYGSDTEPGWTTILSAGDVVMKDPINAPGHWSNDIAFAAIHTQSPRVVAVDGGATGGLDDRFDFIFTSEDLLAYSHGANYIEGTYHAVGQDGLHFNHALVSAPLNEAAPMEILTCLQNMSDHLPIYMEIELQTGPLSLQPNIALEVEVYYDTDSNQLVFKNWNAIVGNGTAKCMIYSTNGQLVQTAVPDGNFMINIQSLPTGTYVLKIEGANFSYKFVKP
ncbi:MAG: T9SS type A sorting domain-containing protein [Crocinitomix sp.]|nr:T9SS type A sorting domain-containing protein [Crocinitomix sp.]